MYLWIMVGSALVVARRVIGARASSPITSARRFPWGTILVNIFGSFIIGFFATLTGPDGGCSSRAEFDNS